jgi:hypothetical protein
VAGHFILAAENADVTTCESKTLPGLIRRDSSSQSTTFSGNSSMAKTGTAEGGNHGFT